MVTAGSVPPSGGEVFKAVVRGRWFQVFASFLIMAAAGATYLYGAYSKDIKSTLGYTQEQIATIGFFKDLGANIGVLSGLINEVTPTWVVLTIGAAMNFAGYFMIYLVINGKLTNVKFWHMCLYIYLGANSQSFTNTGSVVTCVKNFPEDRGSLLGLLKGYTGLSGALITQVYLAIYGTDSNKAMPLLIAWLPSVISLLFLPVIRLLPPGPRRRKGDPNLLKTFLYLSLILAACLLVLLLLEKNIKLAQPLYIVGAMVSILVLFLPLIPIAKEEVRLLKKKHAEVPSSIDVGNQSQLQQTALQEGVKSSSTGTRWYQNVFKPPPRGEDHTILQAVLSLDMMILLSASFFGLGGDLATLDNLGQVGQSLGYSQGAIGPFLAVTLIWGYLGRVFAGFVSEHLVKKYKIPRPLWLTLALILSGLAQLCLAFGIPGALYFTAVLLGFSFGAQLPLVFAIISEIFGLKYYATLFNVGQLASPAGSYLLGTKLVGRWYDHEALKQRAAGIVHPAANAKELVCIGVRCFKRAFLTIAGLSFFGALVTLVLVFRTREFYKSDIYARFRHEPDEVVLEKENGREQKL